ncbi:hypothetical protein HHI36_008222 [Cryptolaemus montrouzieri]|uniref:Salivary secreted peptide n=1 Tax=Cryptolaemus montrouzieri TaxID=559131 RepID=A0ABD2MSD8_9CUCU
MKLVAIIWSILVLLIQVMEIYSENTTEPIEPRNSSVNGESEVLFAPSFVDVPKRCPDGQIMDEIRGCVEKL